MSPKKPFPRNKPLGKLQMPVIELGQDLGEDELCILAQHLRNVTPPTRMRILDKLSKPNKHALVALFASEDDVPKHLSDYGKNALRVILKMPTVEARKRLFFTLERDARFAVLKALADQTL